MGAAAYRRGSKAIAESISRDFPVIRDDAEPLVWTDQRDAMQAEILNLQARVAALTADLDAARVETAATQKRSDLWKAYALRFMRARDALAARHAWAWKLIRAYLSPGRVDEFRSEEPEPKS